MEINPEVTNLIEGTVKNLFEEQFENSVLCHLSLSKNKSYKLAYGSFYSVV